MAINHSMDHSVTAASYLQEFPTPKPPSLVSLCLRVVEKHFEDIIVVLGDIAASFPADIKMAMAAIARRRKLLNDDVIIALAESLWEILHIFGSDVSDFGLSKVAEACKVLRGMDIRYGIWIFTELPVAKYFRPCHKNGYVIGLVSSSIPIKRNVLPYAIVTVRAF
ncbi:hypothetical protein RHGRI_018712 [Rhododendron griersonianum]|uniref:Uncharacterized protein n=1 Tax=Rhododendron griersonianum TaxID=479676 RepID=A0AAV6K2J3_9ERIC|nr:hypothetical protein RHGRI_018712 [Rhododendron griersonianum]